MRFFVIQLYYMSEPFVYKYTTDDLTSPEREQKLKNVLSAISGIERVDTNMEKRVFRIVSVRPLSQQEVEGVFEKYGFRIHAVNPPSASSVSQKTFPSADQKIVTVGIAGMTCRSCELTVERKWKILPGIKNVDVNAATGQARVVVEGDMPSLAQLQHALGDQKYTVHHGSKKHIAPRTIQHKRPSFLRLLGLFALVFIAGQIFLKLGLLKTNFSVGSGMSFGAIFVIGLVAASSSCIAITGGLLLSAAAKFNERYASARSIARMRPVVLFVAGRIVSYTILGGLLGIVGAALSPSPTVTAIIAIIAAIYMIIMGLDMLHIAPTWLKACMPRMPKRLSHRIMDAEGKEHPLAPFGLGAATFFLPCGFTQALQLYALTTGSFTTGAVLMLAFALGTAPALLALGWASSSLKGKTGRFFFQFSGALVVVLGFWNIQNGLTIVGYPLSFPNVSGASVAEARGNTALSGRMEGDTQVITMNINGGGYSPDQFTLRAGVPVRWEVEGTNAGGCLSVLVSRQLGIQKFLQPGNNVIEFTPSQPGQVAFSCSMGMFRGSFTVLSQI